MTPAARTPYADQLLRRFSRRFRLLSLSLCTMLLVAGSASALIGGAPSLPTDQLPQVDASASHEGVSAATDGKSAEVCIDRSADGNSAYGHIDSAKGKLDAVKGQLPELPESPVAAPSVDRPSLPSASADGCVAVDSSGSASADLCARASGIEKPDLPDTGIETPEVPELPVDTPDLPETPDGIDACGHGSHSDGDASGSADSGTLDKFVKDVRSLWSFFADRF